MSEHLWHDFHADPNLLQHSRVGVTEGVPSNTLLQLDSPRRRSDVVSHDRLRPVRAFAIGVRTGEDPIFSLSEGSMSTPFQQSLSQRFVKRHGFLRRFRLADANDLTDDRTDNAKMFRHEVNVLPLQGEEFAAP